MHAVALLGPALLLAPPGAGANPGAPANAAATAPAPSPAPQAAIDRASDRFRAGDFEGALQSLREAEGPAAAANDPALAPIRFNIARCLEELGRGPDALAAYEKYLALPDEAHRKERAWTSVRALEQRLFGALSVGCRPGTARVEVDGLTPGPAPCPFEQRRLAPGTYIIAVTALGHQPERRTVAVAAGPATTADFSLLALPDAEPAPANSTSPWPWIAFGTGVAAAGAGVFLTFSAIDQRDAAERRPPGSERDGLVDAYHTRETGAWLAYGVGATGLVLGTLLLFLSAEPDEPDTPSPGTTRGAPLTVRF